MLAKPGNYIGAWHNPDDGKAYLDISTVVKTRDEAERLGLEHDQLAYYDLDQGRSIKREEWDTVRRAGPVLPRLEAPTYAVRPVLPREVRAPQEHKDTGEVVVSTRLPDGPEAPARPPGKVLVTRLNALDEVDAERKAAYAEQAWQLPVLTDADRAEVRGDHDAILNRAVERMADNLLWLWHQMAAAVRDRAQQWYAGANYDARQLVDEYRGKYSLNQVAGVMAALSPRKDWFQNVELAKRVLKIVTEAKRTNAFFDPKLYDTSARAAIAAAKLEAKEEGLDARETANLLRKTRRDIKKGRGKYLGHRWKEMDNKGRAYMVRALDDATNTKEYPVILPEGDVGGLARSEKTGKPTMLTWQSFSNIEKAVSILLDGKAANIDLQIGQNHKVRSFYNNILVPWDDRFVTIDTHAVGANTLLPVSTKTPIVIAAMGGTKAKAAGLIGTNLIHAEAYFRAAERLSQELGRRVLPREVQSVTWEVVRGLYTPGQKRAKKKEGVETLPETAARLLQEFNSGTIGRDDYLARLVEAAGGIKPPAWVNDPARRPPHQEGVSQADVPARAPEVPARRRDAGRDTRGASRRAADVAEGNVRDDGRLAPSYAVREFTPIKQDDKVSGLRVTDRIPNQSSIGASLARYELLPGIREVPMAAFGQKQPSFTNAKEEGRTRTLAAQIRQSGAIDPLIVVLDAESEAKGPYVLEGSHRFDALQLLGKSSFPAKVVKDLSDQPSYAVREREEPQPERDASGRIVAPPQTTTPTRPPGPWDTNARNSYAVRRTTLAELQDEASADGVSLKDSVERARAEGRDIDVSEYFNFRRVDLPPEELEHLKDEVIDTVVETGRVPKERESWADINREARQLGGDQLVEQLEPFLKQQAPFRAVRDAARHRINELSQEIFEARKALLGMPPEFTDEQERAIAEKEQTIQKLLDTWMRIRSEDGRNLAMHRMMSDAVGWDWADNTYWLSRAKRELGLPTGVDLPADIYAKLQDILQRGKQATDEAAQESGESRGPMTRRPPVQGPVLPPVESRGPMTRGEPVQGPVLPPQESRGPMSRPAPVEGPVLPPVESRGPMTRGAPVQGPVLPPEKSRGRMTTGGRAPVQGPVLPPEPRRGRMTRRSTPKEQAVQRELADFITKLKKTDLLSAISMFRKAGLLTGIKTHLRNLGGNTAFQAMEELSRVPASIVDMLISLGSGQRTVQGLSPTAVARSSYEAATKGVQEAGDILRSGSHSAGELLKLGAPREMNTGNKWFDNYVNYIFRSLSAEDRLFRTYAFRRSLEAQAAMQARQSKGAQTAADILAQPTDGMKARALADAELATFNNPNILARGWQAMHGTLRRGGLAGRLAAFGLDVTVPFTNTPANILARLLDYTPISAVPRMAVAAKRGLTSGGGGDAGAGGGKPPTPQAQAAAQQLVKKGLTPSQQEIFSMAMGRGLVGSAMLYLGYQLARKGLATGVTDEDEGAKNVKEAAGQQPGSVLVNGQWRRIDSVAPVGNLVTLGATLAEHGTENFVTNIAATAGKTVSEQPMLQGMSQATDMLQQPEQKAGRFFSGQLGSFVPTVVSDIAAATDDYRRETRPSGLADVATRGIKARVPGLRTQLPAKTNVFGEPVAQAKGAVYDPTLPSRDLSDDVIRELQSHDVGVGKTDKVEGVETDAEYRERAARVGQAIKERLRSIVQSDSYLSLDFDQQTALLERAITQARSSVPRPRPQRVAR